LSKSALKRELGKVGIAPQLIQDALEDIEADDEYKLAIDLVRRRWNSVKNLEWQARQRRLSGFLGRRGFGGNVVSSAIRAVEQENR
jgi:regulatory protein